MEIVSKHQLIQIISSARFVIADRYLVSLYPIIQENLREKSVFYVDSPEKSKSMEVYANALDFFLERNINRSDEVMVIGGGATSDLGGFVASTILRGVAWSVVPTTLLAMVDAAIGGKVGINSKTGKNLIGNFHEPKRVYYYYPFLDTLTKSERNSGLGEVVKYAFLDKAIFDLINNNSGLPKIINACSHYKHEVVVADFKESGPRKILNLGHSFGHAFEKTLGIPHGEAVLHGLKLILSLYAPKLLIEFSKLIDTLSLRRDFEQASFEDFSSYFRRDKKIIANQEIELIIPQEIGKMKISKRKIEDVLVEVEDHESFKTYFC